jgi:triosephosphate isomerase
MNLMKKLIVANWKMNGNTTFIRDYFQKFLPLSTSHNIVFCPPFPYLASVNNFLKSTSFYVGAQDCHYEASGAFTGDISATMLQDIGVKYVIIGHSERRSFHHETDQTIQQKLQAALSAGLIPILCIGENEETYVSKRTIPYLQEQLNRALQGFPSSPDIIIAYEPIWAIGTGKTPAFSEIEQIHSEIKEHLKSMGIKAPLLYGGSVTALNAPDIFSQPSVDGALIGGASLKAEDFKKICTFD